jgi:hypothetical protein
MTQGCRSWNSLQPLCLQRRILSEVARCEYLIDRVFDGLSGLGHFRVADVIVV